ncbi:hypothetical protein SMACR_06036 [Sordaria macrospora]|uniref:WGS project CABT00000000 data, contig 2.32 n=2 Tax=Sordaria macrospora TaxID=5147 RepID=F7W5V6_SORMK|nr:uncharacterized protein SMAC_06036 [Sordaria macrospora k-hell]KAA8624166.1 hypothetical protein SMACR_06036 [Sordaria macrospora]WPJ65580.1 hypothetical protein SMAC4_06036 [Sordaria macrospora]CCC12894.1 unnamed protein product [Sordaria macrospora k-hell]
MTYGIPSRQQCCLQHQSYQGPEPETVRQMRSQLETLWQEEDDMDDAVAKRSVIDPESQQQEMRDATIRAKAKAALVLAGIETMGKLVTNGTPGAGGASRGVTEVTAATHEAGTEAARADDNIPTDYPLRSVGGFMNAAAGEAELVQRRRARRVQPLRTMESVEKSRAHIEAEQPTKSGGTMAEESSGALTLVVVKLTRGETVMKGCHCGVVFHWETGYD